MTPMPIHKYQAYPQIDLPDRQWPNTVLDKAPIWCSVDLRDGNQALVEPMGRHKKLRFYNHLLELGFKEIEVGFPAASETDYDFTRHIIENNLIPDDVAIQVLTQSRPELIEKTFAAVDGAKNVIIHLYNSTSTLQRRVVFGLDKDGVKQIALDGAVLIKELAPRLSAKGTNVRMEYSPESFTGTELDYALDVCHGVMEIWQPSTDNPIIFNLPATVEMAPANYHADQIEWMHRHFKERDKIVLSLHPHNDRGTAVAAAELAFMAGAERIEGTLFGNGERTGNVDIVALALNLFSQGVDPELDFTRINETIAVSEECTQLPVPARHPYAGELVYTAFSGSHQDAIKKGMAAKEQANDPVWEVPYLPIDPKDVGRDYEAIIRVNSQSGKGGIAYILDTEFGIDMPKEMQAEFSPLIQKVAEETGKEIKPDTIHEIFNETYIAGGGPFELIDYRINTALGHNDILICEAAVRSGDDVKDIRGEGNGPINAFVHGLRDAFGLKVKFLDYHQHAMGTGSDVSAVCFVKLRGDDGQSRYGAGIHENTNTASLQAIISAVNRLAQA